MTIDVSAPDDADADDVVAGQAYIGACLSGPGVVLQQVEARTRAEERALTVQTLGTSPALSSRIVTALAGINNKTVAVARRKLESAAEIPKWAKTVGGDGKAGSSPRGPARPAIPSDLNSLPAQPPAAKQATRATNDVSHDLKRSREGVKRLTSIGEEWLRQTRLAVARANGGNG